MGATVILTPLGAGLFSFLIVTQILGASMLPKTEGFTNLTWVALCLGTYFCSFAVMAYILHRGMALSMLIPIMSAVIPLALIGVGIVLYGETASLTKIALLSVACIAVGLASAIE